MSQKQGKIVPRNSGKYPLHPDYWSQIRPSELSCDKPGMEPANPQVNPQEDPEEPTTLWSSSTPGRQTPLVRSHAHKTWQPPWLHPNLLSMLLQQKKGRIKGPPKIADSTGKGTKTSLHKERRIFSIVSVKGNKSRIIIDQSLRHPTSRLSTKSTNHANHQAWLRLLWNLASTSNYLPTTRYASKS